MNNPAPTPPGETGTGPDAAGDRRPADFSSQWWADSVVYQVYIRSFVDTEGDGVGDVNGIRAKLPYLTALGVDAVWINPWYPSPMEDGGYDVADYRGIHQAFGSLEEAEALLGEAHGCGLKVLLDIVPNHTSAAHPWFQAALGGDQRARERYVFRPGRGEAGSEPPNNWTSIFGGPAWTRSTSPDGMPGEWYLHLFAPGQPDLEWRSSEVRAEFEDILRFWFDRGVDGFRIDVAHGLSKAEGLPDHLERLSGPQHKAPHPAWDQDAVHEIYRSWRKLADSYEPPRVFVAEAFVPNNERLAQYVRSDELHTAFQFDFLRAPWRASVLREVIDDAISGAASVNAPSTWVLSNHDVVRQVTRYARSQPEHTVESQEQRRRWGEEPADVQLGTRRARAALLLMLALPGVVYLYQGEELGLPEVEDLPSERRQDPTWVQSGGTDPGRDGCRVPLPWSGAAPPFGFSPPGAVADPWLPQPTDWAGLTAETQQADGTSVLTLYRSGLHLRRRLFGTDTGLTWRDAPDGVLAFARGSVECWVNTSGRLVDLPPGEVLLTSTSPEQPGGLAPDTSAWLQR